MTEAVINYIVSTTLLVMLRFANVIKIGYDNIFYYGTHLAFKLNKYSPKKMEFTTVLPINNELTEEDLLIYKEIGEDPPELSEYMRVTLEDPFPFIYSKLSRGNKVTELVDFLDYFKIPSHEYINGTKTFRIKGNKLIRIKVSKGKFRYEIV